MGLIRSEGGNRPKPFSGVFSLLVFPFFSQCSHVCSRSSSPASSLSFGVYVSVHVYTCMLLSLHARALSSSPRSCGTNVQAWVRLSVRVYTRAAQASACEGTREERAGAPLRMSGWMGVACRDVACFSLSPSVCGSVRSAYRTPVFLYLRGACVCVGLRAWLRTLNRPRRVPVSEERETLLFLSEGFFFQEIFSFSFSMSFLRLVNRVWRYLLYARSLSCVCVLNKISFPPAQTPGTQSVTLTYRQRHAFAHTRFLVLVFCKKARLHGKHGTIRLIRQFSLKDCLSSPDDSPLFFHSKRNLTFAPLVGQVHKRR